MIASMFTRKDRFASRLTPSSRFRFPISAACHHITPRRIGAAPLRRICCSCNPQAKGKAKEWTGKALGDKKLEGEGKADQAKGKVQNTVGGIKDAMREDDE